jgi:hypothetical protein
MVTPDAMGFRLAAWVALAFAGALDVLVFATGRSGVGATLAAFTVGGGVFVGMRRAVPAVASLAFALAVVYAGAGWTWDLFNRVEPFDEIAHVVTGFALTPVLAFLALGPWLDAWRAHPVRLAVLIVALGLAAGATWEAVEWILRKLTGIASFTPSLDDAITDMMLGTLGSVMSLGVVAWALRWR